MDLELKQQVVLVTGASKGIGLACAIAFAREGAKVVGISRSVSNLDAAQAQLRELGMDMQVRAVDLHDAAATEAVVNQIETELGPIAALVNCAGAAKRYPPDELDAAALHAAMDAKYFTYMHVLQPVVRHMAPRKRGSIVNIVGQGGRQANPLHIAGGAANAALMLATVGYANAYASQGLRLNVINPGLVHTDRMEEGLQAAIRSSGASRDEIMAGQVREIPSGRVAEPEEVADLAVYLSSSRASYITGAIVPMDGGKASVI